MINHDTHLLQQSTFLIFSDTPSLQPAFIQVVKGTLHLYALTEGCPRQLLTLLQRIPIQIPKFLHVDAAFLVTVWINSTHVSMQDLYPLTVYVWLRGRKRPAVIRKTLRERVTLSYKSPCTTASNNSSCNPSTYGSLSVTSALDESSESFDSQLMIHTIPTFQTLISWPWRDHMPMIDSCLTISQ